VTVDVIDPVSGAVRAVPVALDGETNSGEIRLELAPGANSVQVVARGEAGVGAGVEASVEASVKAWIEVPAQPGEHVSVEFRRMPDGELRAFSRHRDFLVLPDEEPPKPLLLIPPRTDELDLVILVDGTCLHPRTVQDAATNTKIVTLEYLLAPEMADIWQGIVSRLMEFVSNISAKYPKLWAMAAAFGDEPMPMLSNELLKPRYLTYPPIPSGRKLEPSTADQLIQQLHRLPPTPGGDFVDGLADGLRAAGQARWRQSSRKLLLVFGQSPGYSVFDTNDDMTNLLIRKVCVEEEVAALHRMGVEIVTVFHDPPEAAERYRTDLPEVFEHARAQYESLASLREWSCAGPEVETARLASAWLNPPALLARGPSPGLLASEPNR
jgi:hypothetical protein